MTSGFAQGVAQGRSDVGPKWTCATAAWSEAETRTPPILGQPTWLLIP